jgi:hypothetical protein
MATATPSSKPSMTVDDPITRDGPKSVRPSLTIASAHHCGGESELQDIATIVKVLL